MIQGNPSFLCIKLRNCTVTWWSFKKKKFSKGYFDYSCSCFNASKYSTPCLSQSAGRFPSIKKICSSLGRIYLEKLFPAPKLLETSSSREKSNQNKVKKKQVLHLWAQEFLQGSCHPVWELLLPSCLLAQAISQQRRWGACQTKHPSHAQEYHVTPWFLNRYPISPGLPESLKRPHDSTKGSRPPQNRVYSHWPFLVERVEWTHKRCPEIKLFLGKEQKQNKARQAQGDWGYDNRPKGWGGGALNLLHPLRGCGSVHCGRPQRKQQASLSLPATQGA